MKSRLRNAAYALCAMHYALGCSSAPPPPAPPLTAVPPGVVEAMCTRIHDEGIARETTVDLVRTTRPLVTQQSLQAIADAAFFTGHIDVAAVEAAYAVNNHPLPVPAGAGCSWNAVDAAARRSHDTMTLELSAPFRAPFGNHVPGVLARLALGEESATWYWIPLTNRNGTWIASLSMPLSMHE